MIVFRVNRLFCIFFHDLENPRMSALFVYFCWWFPAIIPAYMHIYLFMYLCK